MGQSGDLLARINQSQCWIDAMGSLIRCRRSCLNSVFLLKLSVWVLVLLAIHLLYQGLENETVVHDNTRWSDTATSLIKHRGHHQILQGEPLPKCEVPRLFPINHENHHVHCKRTEPLPYSCQLAKELFLSKLPNKCKDEVPFNICQIKEKVNQHYTVHCDSKVCPSGFSLGSIDPNLGILKWTDYVQTTDLQKQIRKLINSNTEHHDFCFIKCLPLRNDEVEKQKTEQQKIQDETETSEERIFEDYSNFRNVPDPEDSLPKQLLLLPKDFPKPRKEIKKSVNRISFNVYLLDSVSHSHFLRSMPLTINKLRQIQKSGEASVFNFNLMQSLKGRTYENLQVLFAGELYNPTNPFGVQEMPPEAVKTSKLLKSMKDAGYHTMWTEDLCWTWEWGIAKNMVVHSLNENQDVRWQKLRDVLLQSGIDGLNFSLASCEILKANSIRDTFHGPPVVCYNNQHHQHYTLEFLKMRQSKLNSVNQPFFHFTISNVAHEDTGRRVQTLDKDLANYVQFLSTQDDMITVLLADHGNAYGNFMQQTIEARVEMFHPVFIILMSENVAKQLGSRKLNALRINQDRLVSILDLYYTLQSLSPGGSVPVAHKHKDYDVTQHGLLVPVSPNRTCDSVPRISPNVCICSDYEKSVANDSRRGEIAKAIVRKINEVIQENAKTDGKRFGACRQLELKWFGNVKETYPKTDVTLIKMDLHFESGENSSNDEEVIFIVVQSKEIEDSLELKLLSFERMTSYSQYEKCKDPGVPAKLCVCDLPS